MSTHANMVKMTVTSVGADPYTITLGAASSGYQHINAAITANATVDILITMGTTWEVARNCTYTYSATPTSCTITRGTLESSSTGSRITTFDNTAVVSVVATADSGRRWDSAALTYAADTVTTGNVTGVVGTMHGLDIDGMTAARDFVLPTTAATGDRIGVFCTTNAPATAAYVLQIKSGAAGDLINGTDHSSTIWSSLFINGECLVFRCIDSAGPHWIVEYDGRIAQVGRMSLVTTNITSSTAGAWTPTVFNSEDMEFGCVVSATGSGTSTITVRRAGKYLISGGMQANAVTNPADQEQFGWACSANGNVGVGTTPAVFSGNRTSGTAGQGNSGVTAATLAAADVLQHNFIWGTTNNVGLRALTYASFMYVMEVL